LYESAAVLPFLLTAKVHVMFLELTTVRSKQKPRMVTSSYYGMFEVAKYLTIHLLTFGLLNVESTCRGSLITPEEIER